MTQVFVQFDASGDDDEAFLAEAVQRAADSRRLFPHGGFRRLESTDVEMLCALGITGTSSPFSLKERLGLTKSTVSHSLKRLEARRLVRNRLNPDDGRRRVVHLTPAGQRLIKEYVEWLKADVVTVRK